jgi:hypothetical protein
MSMYVSEFRQPTCHVLKKIPGTLKVIPGPKVAWFIRRRAGIGIVIVLLQPSIQ